MSSSPLRRKNRSKCIIYQAELARLGMITHVMRAFRPSFFNDHILICTFLPRYLFSLSSWMHKYSFLHKTTVASVDHRSNDRRTHIAAVQTAIRRNHYCDDKQNGILTHYWECNTSIRPRVVFFSSTSVSWFCSTVATGQQTTATPPCPQRPRPFSWTAGSTATRWPAPTSSPLTHSNSAAVPTPYPPRTRRPSKESCPEPEGHGSLTSSQDHGLNRCPFLLYINVLNVWRCTCEGGNTPRVRFLILTFHMTCPAQVSVLHPNKVVKGLKSGSFPNISHF